jgi:putative NADH-flavin reductase
MHRISADHARNRLHIIVSGTISVAEVEKIVPQIVKATNRLKPGFGVITDLTRFVDGDTRAAAILQRIMEYLHQRGVGRVVRVVGGSRKAIMVFGRHGMSVEGYPVKYVPTLQEAEKFLEEVSEDGVAAAN